MCCTDDQLSPVKEESAADILMAMTMNQERERSSATLKRFSRVNDHIYEDTQSKDISLLSMDCALQVRSPLAYLTRESIHADTRALSVPNVIYI